VVEWPADPLVAPIEEALAERPVSANRNWERGETVSLLLAENVMNGVGTVFSVKGGSQLDETGSLGLPTFGDGLVGEPG
jgi:hypothetical protein